MSWTLRSTGNHTHEIYAIKVCYKSCYKSCNFYPVLVTLSIFHLLVHAETPLRPVSGRYFWTQNRYRCAISKLFATSVAHLNACSGCKFGVSTRTVVTLCAVSSSPAPLTSSCKSSMSRFECYSIDGVRRCLVSEHSDDSTSRCFVLVFEHTWQQITQQNPNSCYVFVQTHPLRGMYLMDARRPCCKIPPPSRQDFSTIRQEYINWSETIFHSMEELCDRIFVT